MRDLTNSNFGLLIAYVLPGVTAIWGVSYFSPTVASWLGATPIATPTVGGFLYVTIAAVMAGLVVSTVRWMILDTVHGWTGIRRPEFDYARLDQNIRAFDLLVRHHYVYYKSNGNMLIAISFAYLARRIAAGFWATPLNWIDVACFLLGSLLFLASRDNLRNYYRRVELSLGSRTMEAVESRKVADCHTNISKGSEQELTKPADSLH